MNTGENLTFYHVNIPDMSSYVVPAEALGECLVNDVEYACDARITLTIEKTQMTQREFDELGDL